MKQNDDEWDSIIYRNKPFMRMLRCETKYYHDSIRS